MQPHELPQGGGIQGGGHRSQRLGTQALEGQTGERHLVLRGSHIGTEKKKLKIKLKKKKLIKKLN